MAVLFKLVPRELVQEYHEAGLLWYEFPPYVIVPIEGTTDLFTYAYPDQTTFPARTNSRLWENDRPETHTQYTFYIQVED